MNHTVAAIIPANLADWKMDVLRLPGHGPSGNGAPARTVAIARRTGVTLHLSEDSDWWTVRKTHKGQTLACVTVHKRSMPRHALKTIETRRKEQREREKQYLSGKAAPQARRAS